MDTVIGIASFVMALGSVGAVCGALLAARTPVSRTWNAVGVPLMCALPAAGALVAWNIVPVLTAFPRTTPSAVALGMPALGLVIGLGLARTFSVPHAIVSTAAARRSAIVFIVSTLVALVLSAAGESQAIDAQLLVIGALAWFWFVQTQPNAHEDAAPVAHGDGMATLALGGAIVCAIGAVMGVRAGVPAWAIAAPLLLCGVAAAIIAHGAARSGAWLSASATAALSMAITVAIAVGSASVALVIHTARMQSEWANEGIVMALAVALFSTPRVRGLAGALPALVLASAGLAVLSHAGMTIRAKPARLAGIVVAIVALGFAAFEMSRRAGL